MKRNGFSTMLVACLASHLASFALASLPPVEMPPFAFAGRIVDYAHVAFDANTSVEVRVKAKDGTLLAKTTTATSGLSAYNYIIYVPIATQAAEGHARVGDEVVFEFVDSDGVVYAGLVPSTKATIGHPGQSAKVDVILASDSDRDGVADEYVETLAYLMWKNGISTYDAAADYDGDGASNYDEYVAGSNPFDMTDRFSVREMAVESGINDCVAFKVLVSQGRTYTVSATGALGKDVSQWIPASFAVEDPSAALQGRYSTGPSETGYRVIYVKKDGASRFYRLQVE